MQGLLGNVHKLQTSRHRPRILIVMFELQKCSLQYPLSKPALDFEAIWVFLHVLFIDFFAWPITCSWATTQVMCTVYNWSLLLILGQNKTRTGVSVGSVCFSSDLTPQWWCYWWHKATCVPVLRQESTQSNRAERFSWGRSVGGWAHVSWELGRRNNSTAAA